MRKRIKKILAVLLCLAMVSAPEAVSAAASSSDPSLPARMEKRLERVASKHSSSFREMLQERDEEAEEAESGEAGESEETTGKEETEEAEGTEESEESVESEGAEEAEDTEESVESEEPEENGETEETEDTEETEESEEEEEEETVPYSMYTYSEVNVKIRTTCATSAYTTPDGETDVVAEIEEGTDLTATFQCDQTGWYQALWENWAVFINDEDCEVVVVLKESDSTLPLLTAADLKSLKQTGSMPWQRCIEAVAPIVVEACEAIHVLPSVCIAQMIKESQIGASKLALAANNLGGIKQGSAKIYPESTWSGASYTYVNSKTGRKTVYKKYDSVNQYVWYRNAMLVQSPYYPGFEGETDPAAAIEILRKGGYWEGKETSYCKDIISIINKYNLTKYDQQLSWVS